MMSEYVTCPYCGQDDSTPWAEENGWQAVRCVPCGMVYVNPRPSSDSVHEAVRLGVHNKEVGSFEVIGRFHPTKIGKLRKRLLDLFPDGDLRSGTIRWLDIGTGYGEMLLTLQDIGGDQVAACGVEPCRPKLEKARSMGLKVEESLAPLTGEYEYISLINVFSHIPEPRQFIMGLRQYLKPGGELLLVTGNGGDIHPRFYPGSFYFPDHLVFAGESHIRGLLEQTGFRITAMRRYREFIPENLMIGTAKHVGKKF